MTPPQHQHACCSCKGGAEGCGVLPSVNRRRFLNLSGATLGSALLSSCFRGVVTAEEGGADFEEVAPVTCSGPGARYVPTVKAVGYFRPRDEKGYASGGETYVTHDVEAAFQDYRRQLRDGADKLGVKLDLEPQPLHGAEAAARWVAEAKEQQPDGLVAMNLDLGTRGIDAAIAAAGLPTVFFLPTGILFGRVPDHFRRPGCLLCSTNDFGQVIDGVNMIRAASKLRAMRYLLVSGNRRHEEKMAFFGSSLQYLPESIWKGEYDKVADDAHVKPIAEFYLRAAAERSGPTEADVRNAARCYLAVRNLMHAEEGDAFTMNCLGATSHILPFPCIAFSRLLDQGVPAACERDMSSGICLALSQLLFDRPGFQNNICPDTSDGCMIASHCTGPLRLAGTTAKHQPFILRNHHRRRDAVPVAHWPEGQRVTTIDVSLGAEPRMSIVTGTVVDNLRVPPSAGCAMLVKWKPDGDVDVLNYPIVHNHHFVTFFGDFKKQLTEFCQLARIRAVSA